MRQALGARPPPRNIGRNGSFKAAMAGLVSEGLQEALEVERRIEPRRDVRAAWEALFKDARGCTRCAFYKCGTQTVFGEGSLHASIVFVGASSRVQEDLAGR